MLLTEQLAWTSPRYPSLNLIWHPMNALLVPLTDPPDELLDPKNSGADDPTLALLRDAPDRLLAPYLEGAASGDTIVLPPGRYTDCAIIRVRTLVLRAMVPGTAQFDGGECAGKATLITNGATLVLDGLVFKNIRVGDGNGAGIRHESGLLVVKNTVFFNNQNGILTRADADGLSMEVYDTLFVRNGSCASYGGCAHSIYTGNLDNVIIARSRFVRAAGGHLIKLRAKQIELTDNVLDDTNGIGSYLIDIPYSISGTIQGNLLIKGARSRNRCCAIRLGAEQQGQADFTNLAISDNELRINMPTTVFVWTDGVAGPRLRNNKIPVNAVAQWPLGR